MGVRGILFRRSGTRHQAIKSVLRARLCVSRSRFPVLKGTVVRAVCAQHETWQRDGKTFPTRMGEAVNAVLH